jgi:dTDP-4-dehydrorhamnose reductase
MMALFAELPQQAYRLSAGARFIQISSDGVFSGTRGCYTEIDPPDATDLYGVAKQRGEIDRPDAVTLRTSLLGHTLKGHEGLLEWFLAQKDSCTGFSKAIFSGLPSVVIARLVQDILLVWPQLGGVFHIASEPISKLDLLRHIARRYGKNIKIIADETVVLDRSLIAEKFRLITGRGPRSWPDLIDEMFVDRTTNPTGPHV